MGTVWHYTDKDGNRVEEAFTDVQAGDDAALVTRFQGLENVYALEKDPNKGSEESVARCFEVAETLPPQRKAHWLAEFARIGLKAPKKPAETEVETEVETETVV